MLCAKNLKVVKAALIMILGVGGFTSAQAAFDLTSTPTLKDHDVVVYAAETIDTGAASGAARTTKLYATAGAFMANADVTFELAVNGTYYARYDLVAPDGVTAKFVGLEADDFTADTISGTPEAFDLTGVPSRAIYSFDGTTAAATFTLDMDGEAVNDPATPNVDESVTLAGNNQAARVQVGGAPGGDYKVELRFRIYNSIPAAIGGAAGTYIDVKKPIIAVDNTLSVTAAAASMPLEADVGTSFKMFVANTEAKTTPKSGTLGEVRISVKRMHDPDGAGAHAGWTIMNANDGMAVTPETVMASGTAVVAGDFSAGTFTLGGAAAALKDVNNKDLEKYTEGDNKGKVMDPSLAATATFAISPKGELAMHPAAAATHLVVKPLVVNVDKNETPIPVGSYSATTTAKGKATNAGAIADRTGQAIGSITRNGTTVHIGYLTTYEAHNQRLVIVNRGPMMADYEVGDIVTEEGTMATPGHMASGQIMPKSSKVIQAADLVSFEDGGTTRASATLTLTAKPSDISVSTTLVNRMDRSTDTVVLR